MDKDRLADSMESSSASSGSCDPKTPTVQYQLGGAGPSAFATSSDHFASPLKQTFGPQALGQQTAGVTSEITPSQPHGTSLPGSRRTSGEIQNSQPLAHASTAHETIEDSPLQRVLKSPNAKPLPGHPGNLTPTQNKALHELTVALRQDGAIHNDAYAESEPPSYQDTQLLRFLRARNFNVQAARTMYLKAEAWKKEIGLDKLVREFKFDERQDVAAFGWCMYFHKVDNLGRPIFVQDLGNMDVTNVFKRTTPERVILNFAVTLELAVRHRYEACTVSSGRWVDDNFMVVNLAGLGLSTFWTMKGQLQQLLHILDNNFPELSGRVQIINAPYMFSTIWSWIKGWLPVATAEKIDIAGADFLPTIYRFVPKEDWPKSLGGACTCSEHNGCSNSDLGPWDKRLVRTDT